MRSAPTVPVLAAVLLAQGAFAAPPPAAAQQPASAASAAPATPRIAPADRGRVKAISQYQHDLVSVVALRAEPDYLLGAAILAKPFQQTPGLDFDTLSERAAAAAPAAGAAVDWARLNVCTDPGNCPNAKAFANLKLHAADNAAVWLVAMDVAARDHDAKAERAALHKAAVARIYADYFGKSLAAVAKVLAVLPPLADTTTGAHDGQPDNPDGVRLLVAITATQGHNRPEFTPLLQLCDKANVDQHADIKPDCLKLAHTLQWGSSPMARAVGLRIQGWLQPAEQAQAEQSSRNLAWQVHQYSNLLQHALTDRTLASQWLATARNGGTELSLILATLRNHQIPLEAPADAGTPTNGSSSHP